MSYYLGIIPARGGSKRIQRKNMVLLNDRPLISYTFDAAINSNRLNKVILSSEDSEIIEFARKSCIDVPFIRPLNLASDGSTQVEVLMHSLEQFDAQSYNIDALILLQPTSPFRNAKHINEAIDLFENMNADTVTSVCMANEHPYYMWKKEDDELKPFLTIGHQSVLRQDLPSVYVENGAIYIIKRQVIASGKIYGNRIIPYIMDKISSIDIDAYDDLAYAEFLIKKNQGL